MDSLMGIVLNYPGGMWESIIGGFNSAMGSYIWSVILLAVIVRIVFAVVDIFNKYASMKSSRINEKMRPELEAIQKKYGHDKVLLQKKQQEIYKKYQFSMVGTCLPMLIVLILQMVVFLTLWTGLQNVSNYNIAKQYEDTKMVYYNVLLLNENDNFVSFYNENLDGLIYGEDFNVNATIDVENKQMTLDFYLIENPNEIIYTIRPSDELTENMINFNDDPNVNANQEIYEIITNYADEYVDDAEGNSVSAMRELNSMQLNIKSMAEDITADYYTENLQSFLWIKNIYKAESPTTSPVFDKSEITNYLNKYYSDAEKEIEEQYDYEGKIFDFVVAGLNERDLGANGYYILVILAVVTSFLSIFINNKLMKKGSGGAQQPGGKAMYFIMPIILGIFTLMYTSLFAIYIIVGQIVMMIFSPITNLIVRKWVDKSGKKQEEKRKAVIDVDYRRKDM